MSESAEQFRRSLTEKAESYRDHLLEALSAAGTEVLAPPDVPHMRLVTRAVSRRRPCDENRDGYRDTLSWLTVLGSTTDNPGEKVVLVTNDSDFMNDERSTLHPDLVEDLESISATERVKLAHALGEVILELAARSPEQGGLKALRAELQQEAVSQYVASLVGTLFGTPEEL